MPPEIRFCTTSDNVRIAYVTLGEGPPLVTIPGWVSHLEMTLNMPELPGGARHLARRMQVTTYDKRGTGLSDRNLGDYSVAQRVKDIEAVVKAAGLKRFALSGYSEGGPVAITYAAQHPRQVSHLILRSTYGRYPKGGERQQQMRDALVALVRAEWGLGSHTLSDIIVPEAPAEMRESWLQLQRMGAGREDAALMLEAIYNTDVSEVLPKVRVPTLVLHGRSDTAIPFTAGRELAGSIAGARFVPFDGGHVAAPEVMAQNTRLVMEFLGVDDGGDVTPAPTERPATAPGAFATIVFTDVERNTQILQRLGDGAWRDLLREHEQITRDLLRAHGGAEVKAMGDGFLASFGSPSAALDCAIAVQRAFDARNVRAAEPLLVRIGINAGEPIAEDGDLFGTAVSMAARIAASGKGAEIVASNVVRELVAGKGFLFADRGDTALRGFEDPVRLYELRWRE